MHQLRAHFVAVVCTLGACRLLTYAIPVRAQKVIVETALNLRGSPSKSGSQFHILNRGEVVDLIGADSLVNGFHVRTSDKGEGWIDFVTSGFDATRL